MRMVHVTAPAVRRWQPASEMCRVTRPSDCLPSPRYNPTSPTPPPPLRSGLMHVDWLRVVLDEAQSVKNANAQQVGARRAARTLPACKAAGRQRAVARCHHLLHKRPVQAVVGGRPWRRRRGLQQRWLGLPRVRPWRPSACSARACSSAEWGGCGVRPARSPRRRRRSRRSAVGPSPALQSRCPCRPGRRGSSSSSTAPAAPANLAQGAASAPPAAAMILPQRRPPARLPQPLPRAVCGRSKQQLPSSAPGAPLAALLASLAHQETENRQHTLPHCSPPPPPPAPFKPAEPPGRPARPAGLPAPGPAATAPALHARAGAAHQAARPARLQEPAGGLGGGGVQGGQCVCGGGLQGPQPDLRQAKHLLPTDRHVIPPPHPLLAPLQVLMGAIALRRTKDMQVGRARQAGLLG
jgi:hypothetical protein